MKVTFLTAGTGSYHCGACMRDNSLVTALHRDGHEVALLPMYLPLMLDEEVLPQVKEAPIFFGGINVFLQQKFSLFRHTPAWLDRLLNGTKLLKSAARRSHMTSARQQGELALAMLRVEESRLTKELDKLVDWLEHHERPDVICLSNALLAGLARELKRRLKIPIIAFFQGEDTFLDSLPEPFRSECWAEMGTRLKEADLLVSPTRFYAEMMAKRLGLVASEIAILPNGIVLDGYGPHAPEKEPVIGYLARMCKVKGIEVLVEAFIALRAEAKYETVQLRIGGSCTTADEELINELKKRLDRAGLAEAVDWRPNLTREEKADLLRSLSIFSVPVTYPEAFGLYVVEAMASGVPVVQPDGASFPEIVEATGGGVLVPSEDPAALAAAWAKLLDDPAEMQALGERGRRRTEEQYSVDAMKDGFVKLAGKVLGETATAGHEPQKRELIS